MRKLFDFPRPLIVAIIVAATLAILYFFVWPVICTPDVDCAEYKEADYLNQGQK